MTMPKDPEKQELWRKRQSEAQRGKRGPNAKKKGALSLEHKAKLAAKSANRKKSDEEKNKIGESHKKRHASMSKEQREAISEKYKKWYNSLSEEEKYTFLKPWINAGMRQNGSISKKEKELGEYLKSKGLEFESQKMIDQYYVDFFIRSHNLVIEFNGCFWHQCDQCGHNKGIRGVSSDVVHEYDKNRIEHLKSRGYKVKIIWEHDLDKIIRKQ